MTEILFRGLDELEKAAILGGVIRVVSISQQPATLIEISDAVLKSLELQNENEIGSLEVGRALMILCNSGLIESDGFRRTAGESSLDLGATTTFRPKRAVISWLCTYAPGVSP